jgi:hypothetical protein
VCLPPVTKSAQVTWYKQAKGVQPEKMHMPNASNLEENCVPTTSHKVFSSDMAQASKRCPAIKGAFATCTKPKGKVCAYHQSQSLLASSSRAEMPDAASPLAGKRRGPESMSDAESSGTAEAPSADSLAMVPLTPDDSHAPSLRRSSREHKKPRPYYAGSQAEPPDKPSTSKGLQRGFLK